ncbi:glycoside hydrolase family 18 protein [Chitiniphilus purpureus]|uniref:chitinase n=1 Tax=Chitiniphilus purpureus TaxID=2981137 RepID=A0ABY6DR47_9NEIS|nr:glycoside hydrolase family 18 protein [Chitiniphilus sp. CD1]UXY16844.1 glycoside hydrolase family 18 protein [Chitiniphilus sp. CD1]
MLKYVTPIVLAAVLAACGSDGDNTVRPTPTPTPTPVPTPVPLAGELVSYVRTWPLGSTRADMDKGVYWRAEDIKGDRISRLNIAFGLIRNGTEVYIRELEPQPTSDGTGTIAPFSNMWDEVAKLQAKYPYLKINFSIGGWGADGFSDMALTKESRAKFIENVLAVVRERKLSGVDIDWEYPVGPPWGGSEIKVRPEDRENYPLLLEEMKAALNQLSAETKQSYALSTAVPVANWFFQANDIPRVAKAVDFLKVMAYDMYGGWSPNTGHHANLYPNPADPAAGGGRSVSQAMQAYLNLGVPPEKLLMGVAFYGRAWRGVTPTNNGLYQKFTSAAFPDGVTWVDLKRDFIDKNGYVRYWDDVAKAPYLFNGDTFITYEDAEGLRYKADFMKEKQLGGIMIWEHAHDMDGELITQLNQYMRK